MSFPDQPLTGQPNQPQPPAYPNPSQPSYPGQTYPNPSQPVYPGQTYPNPSQPAYQGQYPPPAWPPTAPGGYPPSQTGYPPDYRPAPQLTPIAPKKGNNSTGLIIGIGTTIVVLALLGAFALLSKAGASTATTARHPIPTATVTPTATPTTGTIPPPPAGFTTFKASDGSYGLNYPSDWTNTGQSQQGITLVIFGSPDAQDFFMTLPSPSQLPTSEYAKLAQVFAQGAGAKNIKISSHTSRVRYGSNVWTRVTGSMVFQNTNDNLVVLGTDHNGATMLLLYFAPSAQWSAVGKTDFVPMLTSFTFLK
jgi:hypothetical protein